MNTSHLPDGEYLHRLADLADRITLEYYRTELDIDEKVKPGYTFDPVTQADRETELALRAMISETFPTHGILGEEFGAAGDTSIQWVIDPIDGTRPYICGIPVWGTLVGLTQNGHAKIGIMSQPVTGERFWSAGNQSWARWRGNDRLLRSKQNRSMAAAILHTNSPDRYPEFPKIAVGKLRKQTRMTRYGGECYAFAMLAAGQIDICLELALQPYDIVALIPIIEQAGGVVSDLNGDRVEAGGHVLASANPWLHEAALNILNS